MTTGGLLRQIVLATLSFVHAKDLSLSLTPPMGWRSWNLFGPHVNQTLLESIMDGLVSVRRPTQHNNNTTLVSLCDLGYCNVGLDDNWQACDSPQAAAEMHYHQENGEPVINTERFPDMEAMTAHGHALGLTVGWYANNCICPDQCRTEAECTLQIQGDVAALRRFQFDAVKLDGCGGQKDLDEWDRAMMETQSTGSRGVEVENCHWGVDVPHRDSSDGSLYCPYHFYRTSGDIRPNYGSVMHNLGTVEKFRSQNLSVPGCWAYPDMLQVGVTRNYNGEDGLTIAEMR